MGTIVHGTFLGQQQRTVEYNNQSWVETTWHILDGVAVENVRLSKEFASPVPDEHDVVAVEVAMNAWQSKRGSVGVQLTGIRRVPVLEAAITAAARLPEQRSKVS